MKITDQIHLIKHPFSIPISPDKNMERFVYSVILFDKYITLIDSGVKGSYEAIFEYLRKQRRSEYEIQTLILSHSHPDHIGSAAEIKSITGCRVMAHTGEQAWIEDIDKQYRERPVPGFYNLVDRSVVIDQLLSDNYEMQLGPMLNIKILHTPGHSNGSLSFYFPEHRLLFTADAVPLPNDIPNYDNYLELKQSLKKIRKISPVDILCSSWTEPATSQSQIQDLIGNGEAYMDTLHKAVIRFYNPSDLPDMENCKKLVSSLSMPPVFINPIVHRAFLSHFRA